MGKLASLNSTYLVTKLRAYGGPGKIFPIVARYPEQNGGKEGCGVCRADEQEYRLTRYLMSNYDPAVRPSFNSSLSLRVDLDLSLLQLLDVRWTDAHLKWNASDFGGIGVLRIPSAQVWKPDLVLYNK
ncbi:hypothetical protein MTO96_008299 [Rhipicephalus appendiculatus]